MGIGSLGGLGPVYVREVQVGRSPKEPSSMAATMLLSDSIVNRTNSPDLLPANGFQPKETPTALGVGGNVNLIG